MRRASIRRWRCEASDDGGRFPLTVERSGASFLSSIERSRVAKEQRRPPAGHARHAGAQGAAARADARLGHHRAHRAVVGEVLQLGQGTLYPALYRLERQGLIRSEWKVTENNRRARYYSLTRGAGGISTTSWRSGAACPAPSTWCSTPPWTSETHHELDQGGLAAAAFARPSRRARTRPRRRDSLPPRAADRQEPAAPA